MLGIIWLAAPYIAYYISFKSDKKEQKISKEDKEYIKEIAYKTWKFFEEHINETGNFLPPDNYQENRVEKVAYRTSPTNMGLGLLSVISALDLGFIKYQECIEILDKMLKVIDELQKWNGHLYNWYNTKTLEPLNPRFISTVDSGNFVGYLYVLKQAIPHAANATIPLAKGDPGAIDELDTKINNMLGIIDSLINNTDFSVLYSHKNNLFSIGFNIEENELIDSYYDLLASEARQASLIAIAKRDVTPKHWNGLSRTLTCINGYKGLISWSGTAFEYLMPNVNIRKYPRNITR